MIRICVLSACLILAAVLSSHDARAQDVAADSSLALPSEWSTYYVVLVKPGPVGADTRPADSLNALMSRHIQYQLRLQASGRAIAAGGFGGITAGMTGMTLLRAESREEAVHVAEGDPAVAAGHFAVEVAEWYVPAGRLPDP